MIYLLNVFFECGVLITTCFEISVSLDGHGADYYANHMEVVYSASF